MRAPAVLALFCIRSASVTRPVEDFATLMDESRILCSICTMYRILTWNGKLNERRICFVNRDA
jgi:hypothetical protein